MALTAAAPLPAFAMRPGAPPPPAPERAPVVLDPDGSPYAWGWRDAGERWLQIAGLATFRIAAGGASVTALTDAGAPAGEVVAAYWSTVLPLVLCDRGCEALHAASVRTPDGVVAIAALSGTGKTTLAHVLAARAGELWGDDALVLAPGDDDPPLCLPAPFAATLREPARAALGSPAPVVVDERAAAARDPAPLRCIVLPERAEPGSPPRVDRPAGGEAVRRLLAHAYRADPGDATRVALAAARWVDVAARVAVLRLRFAPGLAELPRVVATLLEAVDAV